MKELTDQYRKPKIGFWAYYWKNTKLLQGFIVAGIAFLLVIESKEHDFWNVFFIWAAVWLNIVVVIVSWFQWQKL